MVDVSLLEKALLREDRRLRVLFVDFNAFFASCEQAERPELRGKPVVVAAVDTDTTMAIAASYEAKAFGIKTGTAIWEAKQKCPGLIVASARPRVYKAYHEAIRAVCARVLPEEKVHSIDEMSFRLLGDEREPANARALALEMKAAIRDQLGDQIRCSIGIAPNQFLAKLATEVEKPDGLVILEAASLPGRLLELPLTGFTGINKKMERRLNAAMVFSASDLYRLTPSELRMAFGSVTGERWWYWLRGLDMPEVDRGPKTLGHSNVLAPSLRNLRSCREVLLRLLQKAASRLRSGELYTSAMTVVVTGSERSWVGERRFEPTQDTVLLQRELDAAWASCNAVGPRKVGVTFHHLTPSTGVTPSLFAEPEDEATARLSRVLDEVNRKFGKNSVHLASVHDVRDAASEKIAFQKTWLFSEGRGDNEWIDTFRGLTGDS
jgi:DNA polymerase-4